MFRVNLLEHNGGQKDYWGLIDRLSSLTSREKAKRTSFSLNVNKLQWPGVCVWLTALEELQCFDSLFCSCGNRSQNNFRLIKKSNYVKNRNQPILLLQIFISFRVIKDWIFPEHSLELLLQFLADFLFKFLSRLLWNQIAMLNAKENEIKRKLPKSTHTLTHTANKCYHKLKEKILVPDQLEQLSFRIWKLDTKFKKFLQHVWKKLNFQKTWHSVGG